MRDGRSEEPAGKKNQTSLSAGEAQLRVVSSQTVPESVGRTQMFRMFWKWRLVRQTEKGREMRVGCAQVSAGLGHGVRAATGGLWGFPGEQGSVREQGTPQVRHGRASGEEHSTGVFLRFVAQGQSAS